MFTSHSKNPTTRAIFYTFEVCAAIVALIYLIYAVCLWVDNWGFISGLTAIGQGVTYALVLYGLGKIIDSHPQKPCDKRPSEVRRPPEDEQKTEEIEDSEEN